MSLIYDGTKVVRPEIADPRLSRPDWTTGAARPESLLWLDKNENTDPVLAEQNSSLLHKLDPKFLFTYPETAVLYQKLADWVGVKSDNLILTAGSDGVIRSVFEAFVTKGTRVLHTQPTFAMYSVYCLMYGAESLSVSYERGPNGPILTEQRLISEISRFRPQVVCLPNPDSPTGTVFPPESLKRIINAAGDAGAIILIDEAYHPFYENTAVPWIQEWGHLIVARTFAKAWGLSGLRVGYGVASPALTQLLHKVRPMYEVNTLAVAMLDQVIEHPEWMQASVQRLNEGKIYFLDEMQKLGFSTLNGEGNFLHVAFGDKAAKVHQALNAIVLYRKDFQDPCLKGFSRFSSTTKKIFEPVVDAIRNAI